MQCEDDHQSPRSLYTIFNDPRGSLIQSLCAHLPSANLREYQFFIFLPLRKGYIERAGEGVQSRLIDHNRPRAVAGPFKKKGMGGESGTPGRYKPSAQWQIKGIYN